MPWHGEFAGNRPLGEPIQAEMPSNTYVRCAAARQGGVWFCGDLDIDAGNRTWRCADKVLVRGHGEGLVEEGLKEAGTSDIGSGETRLQPVAEGHELVDLGNDAMLLGEGGNANAHSK